MAKTVEDLLGLFDQFITEEDIITSDLLSKISNKIIKNRLDNNMTQKEFADFLNLSQSMVSKIESEQYNFTIEMLVKICIKLKLKLDVEMKSVTDTLYETTTYSYNIDSLNSINNYTSIDSEQLTNEFSGFDSNGSTYKKTPNIVFCS